MQSSKLTFQKRYKIFADYFQFYLMDAVEYPYAPEDFTNEDLRRKIMARKHIVVIFPVRNMTIPVEVEVFDVAPEVNLDEWQHVAEASLELSSGKLLIEELGGKSVDTISLSPSAYRIRVFYGDLDKLSFNGLEGEDHYKIVMWPAQYEKIKVLKQYEN